MHVLLIDFRKTKMFFWYIFSIFLINAFCSNLIKFVNKEVNPHLEQSAPTIWLKSQQKIKQTLTPPKPQLAQPPPLPKRLNLLPLPYFKGMWGIDNMPIHAIFL